jgi:hypothetical protein
MNTAIVRPEPLKISTSPIQTQDPREQRALSLALKYVKFIGDLVPEIIEVRQDFLDKGDDETICGCRTFTEYCTKVLRASASHIRNLIAGQNPANKFSAKNPHRRFRKTNRQIADEGAERQHAIEVQEAYDRGFEDGRAAEKKAQEILAYSR